MTLGAFGQFVAKVFVIFCILAIMFMCLAGLFIGSGHAATTSKRPNAFGAVITDTDPNMTLVASLLSGDVHKDNDGRLGFNLRLHPKYSYGLFDQSVMFCGDIRPMAEGKATQYLAWTYRRAASRLIDGIPCHLLVGVDEVKATEGR